MTERGGSPSDWIGPEPAGLRAVRRVAQAEGIDEWLMVGTLASEQNPGSDPAAAPLLLRVLPFGRERAAYARMIAAADRLDSAHVAGWSDLDDWPDGELCLSRDWLPHGTLDELLEGRERLATGEAVTILAPVLETLADAHRLGVAFGDLRGASIAFTAAGAPVIEITESCSLHEPGLPSAALVSLPEVAADRVAALALCRRVAAQAHGSGSAALRSLVAASGAVGSEASDTAGDGDDGAHLEAILLGMFDIAAGSPVRFASGQEPVPGVASPAIPGRIEVADLGDARRRGSGADAGRADPAAGSEPSSYRARWASVLQVPQWLDPLIGRAVDGDPARSARQAARRLWSSLPSRTRRLAVAGAAAGATAVVAVLLVPTGDTAPSRADDVSSSAPAEAPPRVDDVTDEDASSSAAPGTSVHADGDGVADDDVADDDVADDGDSAAGPEDAAAAIGGDDPVRAARVLLEARERCLRDLDALCLRDVHQAGSTALARDKASIEAIEAGEATDDALAIAAASSPALVERLGDSAILLVGPETAPASLLLMRSEAGWRIRELREPTG